MAPRLPIFTSKGKLFFKPEEIIRLEATSNYTTIFLTHDRHYLTAKVLKSYEAILEDFGFIRVHRTHLLNPEQIQSIQKGGLIKMMDETMIQVARRKRRVVRRNLYLL